MLRFATIRVGVIALDVRGQAAEFDVRILMDSDGGYRVLSPGDLSERLPSLEAAVQRVEAGEPVPPDVSRVVRWRPDLRPLVPDEIPCPICGAPSSVSAGTRGCCARRASGKPPMQAADRFASSTPARAAASRRATPTTAHLTRATSASFAAFAAGPTSITSAASWFSRTIASRSARTDPVNPDSQTPSCCFSNAGCSAGSRAAAAAR